MNQGLTSNEWRQFKDLLTKSNTAQLYHATREVELEIKKRASVEVTETGTIILGETITQ